MAGRSCFQYLFTDEAAADGAPMLCSINSDAPIAVPGLTAEDDILHAAQGDEVLVRRRNELPVRVYRVNFRTGERVATPVLEYAPDDRSGLNYLPVPFFSTEGGVYMIEIIRMLNDVFIVDYLK